MNIKKWHSIDFEDIYTVFFMGFSLLRRDDFQVEVINNYWYNKKVLNR